MKRIIPVFLLMIFMSACSSEYQPRKLEDFKLEILSIDSSSIRAIHTTTKNRLFFGASNGFGIYENQNARVQPLYYMDSLLLNFRSIGFNGKDHFVLSIGNPAVLLKINSNGDSEIVYKEEHEKVFYDSMKFFDGQNGIAMGDPIDDCLSIIITRDGGKSWNKIPCSQLPKTAQGEAAFAASNTNIKVIDKTVWIVTGGSKARVFKSMDLGENWEVFETPIVQGKGSQGIYSVDFIDQNRGFIIGGDYSQPELNVANKAMTSDGGKTWSLVLDGQNPNYKSCVQYVPNTDGKEIFAVGKTGISYSADGGSSWNSLSEEGFYTILFVDKDFAWLAGHQKIGKLYIEK